MLLCLLFGAVFPGVGGFVLQPAFSLLEVPDKDNGAVVDTAPTSGYGASASQGQLLAAVASEDDAGRVLLIGPAKWTFLDLVMPFDADADLRHSPYPSCRPTRPEKAREDSEMSVTFTDSTTCIALGAT